ncbi:MAG TPA: carboxyl transferase domain-containing protein [Citricoccus sp.]|nr:carboxyl transferase domain-containing protein [Citricoccus sp.]
MIAAPDRALQGAAEVLDILVDPGTFQSWDDPVDHGHLEEDYARDLGRAREVTGLDEAVVTGRATIGGRPVGVIASDFRFLGGTIGVLTARRIAAAFRRAAREGLPVVAAPSSGGTRMQEGTHAFLAMLDIAEALRVFRETGRAYLVYLRHPTTGGVMASWGSLGHVTFAEPGALVGFLGPRAVEAITGEAIPEGVQRAENLADVGLVDAVVSPSQIRSVLDRALGLMSAPDGGSPAGDVTGSPPASQVAVRAAVPTNPWDAVLATRDARYPRFQDLVRSLGDVLPLSGTAEGAAESGVGVVLARFGRLNAVVVGQTGDPGRPLGPDSLRIARRGIRLAGELGLAVVTVIDTPGATLSAAAEEGGLAGQIARTLGDLTALQVPTVSVLLGQGCGGAALALLPADRTVASSHAWISPLPPEGASAIVHRTPDLAPRVARHQGIGLGGLLRLGIVDEVVAYPAGGAAGNEEFLAGLRERIGDHLAQVTPAEQGPVGTPAAAPDAVPVRPGVTGTAGGRPEARMERYRRIVGLPLVA